MSQRPLRIRILAAALCAAAVAGAWHEWGSAGNPAAQLDAAASLLMQKTSVATTPANSGAESAETSAQDPSGLSAEALLQRVQPDGAVANEAVLTFRTQAAYEAFLKRAAAAGLTVKGRMDARRTVHVAFDSLDMLQGELAAHAGDYAAFGAVFPVFQPGLPPKEQRQAGIGDEPFGDSLFSALGADAGVDRTQWGRGVTVAVLDSGVATHPAFAENQVTHIDLVNDGQPFDGHGTAMASLIVGGVRGAEGVSPAAHILDVRIAGADGFSDSFLLASGIQAAVDHGAQVINISYGSYGDSPVVAQAVSDALKRGVVIVASAGNEQSSAKDWPAAYPGVISVSGVDAAGQLAYFSNTGNPTLAAPAVGIPSAFTKNNEPYLAVGDGTSQAAALVSGAAAAILGKGGNVKFTLTNTAKPVSASARQTGAGMLHLSAGQ
jgi:thermitase